MMLETEQLLPKAESRKQKFIGVVGFSFQPLAFSPQRAGGTYA